MIGKVVDYDSWTLERLFAGRALLQADLRAGTLVSGGGRWLWSRQLVRELARVNAAIVRRRVTESLPQRPQSNNRRRDLP